MKSTTLQLLVAATITASLFIGCTSQPRRVVDLTDPARPSDVQVREGYDTLGRKWEVFTRSESILLSYVGTIVDLDYADREITIRGPEGQLESFFVHPKVQRLDEARVGDKVSIDYYLGVDAEVREPSYEERTNPYKVLGSTQARASSDAAPQAYDFRRVRAVATIEAIDKTAQTVTVKGPRGRYFTARVKDPSRLDRVSPGNQIVMIFTEATAVALKPQVMTRSDSVRLQ